MLGSHGTQKTGGRDQARAEKVRRAILWGVAAVAFVAVVASVYLGYGRRLWHPRVVDLTGGQTHEQVVARLGPIYRPALQAAVAEAGSNYPPDRLRLIVRGVSVRG